MLKWSLPVAGLMFAVLCGCAPQSASPEKYFQTASKIGWSIPVAEVLQQPLDAKIYTRYTLWSKTKDISSLNIQQGRILPPGSEVEAIYADERLLQLKDVKGHEYNIYFEPGEQLCDMRAFIRQLLTLQAPDKEFADIRPAMLPYVMRGEVVPGMNRREVTAAYGPPAKSRTPFPVNDTWIYWITPDQTIRVVFRGDTVRSILNVNEGDYVR
ncbi:MAG: hypothetical protein IJC34_01610 [Lentisphaeria bacterium]|nr:hypothetical protein [Lentisphaeria bacterium]